MEGWRPHYLRWTKTSLFPIGMEGISSGHALWVRTNAQLTSAPGRSRTPGLPCKSLANLLTCLLSDDEELKARRSSKGIWRGQAISVMFATTPEQF